MHTFALRQHSPSPLISLKTKYNVGTGEHSVIGFGGVDWQPVWESSTDWFDPNTELREAFARAGKEFPEGDGEADRLYDAFDEFRAGDSVQAHLDEFDAEARRFADDCVGLVTYMVGERLSVGKLDERYAEVTGLMNDDLANRADEFVATLDAADAPADEPEVPHIVQPPEPVGDVTPAPETRH